MVRLVLFTGSPFGFSSFYNVLTTGHEKFLQFQDFRFWFLLVSNLLRFLRTVNLRYTIDLT